MLLWSTFSAALLFFSSSNLFYFCAALTGHGTCFNDSKVRTESGAETGFGGYQRFRRTRNISRAVCVSSASSAHIRAADPQQSRAGNPDSCTTGDTSEPLNSFSRVFSVVVYFNISCRVIKQVDT